MHRPWGAYPETVITFPDTGLVVDLRRPVTPILRQRLGEIGLAGPFGIVTACNPLGTQIGAEVNRRLSAVLGCRVAGYAGSRPVVGASPDASHQEPGWAIPAPLDQVRRLAAEFLQNALFWFDGERFSIVPVHGAGQALSLPASSQDKHQQTADADRTD
jgi:hypothetical protein